MKHSKNIALHLAFPSAQTTSDASTQTVMKPAVHLKREDRSHHNSIYLVAATEVDAANIHAMAHACFVGKLSTFNKGFLVYPPPQSDIALAVKLKQPCYLFINSQGAYIGFICGFALDNMDSYVSQCTDLSIASTLMKIRAIAAKQGNHNGVVIHQMALIPEMQGKGMGARCFQLFADLHPVPIYGLVAAAPIANPRISLWRALGFHEVTRLLLSGPVVSNNLHPEPIATATEEWTWILLAYSPRTHTQAIFN